MADIVWRQAHAGGRIVALLGRIEVGAVFPDPILPAARWSFWLTGTTLTPTAPTVDSAKARLVARVDQWLSDAQLIHRGRA